jgi:hypothetical protein
MTDASAILAELARTTGLTPDQTEAALGTLLGAVQISLPSALFASIEQAIPEARKLINRGASPMGGRTGEITAVTTLRTPESAGRLADQLQKSGLSAAQVGQIAQWLVGQLRAKLGGGADAALAALPGLQRLVAGS